MGRNRKPDHLIISGPYYLKNRERLLATAKAKRLADPERAKKLLLKQIADAERLEAVLAPDVAFRENLNLQRPHEIMRIERYRANKTHFIERLGGKCEDCGNTFPPECMDFAHRDPATKTAGLAKFFYLEDRDIIWAEVQKCRLLCANCHRIETFANDHHRNRRAQL